MTLKTPDWQGWMLSVALAISLALGSCAANALASRQDKAETRLGDVEKRGATQGERLASLEAQAAQNKTDHAEIMRLLNQLVQLELRAARRAGDGQ